MTRGFEKISYDQFKKDVKDDKDLYSSFFLPRRSSENSAGYDLFFLEDTTFSIGEIKKIPTGIKSYMQNDEVLYLIVRSSSGFKYNLRLCNQVGVIDSDYYNNVTNEGHIWLAIQNEGNKEISFKRGDAIAQGVFMKFLKADGDDSIATRVGGLGSTEGGNTYESI